MGLRTYWDGWPLEIENDFSFRQFKEFIPGFSKSDTSSYGLSPLVYLYLQGLFSSVGAKHDYRKDKNDYIFLSFKALVPSDKCRAGQTINKNGKTITINLILVILWPILLWEGDVQSRLAMYLSVFIITLCTSLGSYLSFSYAPLCLYLYLIMYLTRFIFIFFLVNLPSVFMLSWPLLPFVLCIMNKHSQ